MIIQFNDTKTAALARLGAVVVLAATLAACGSSGARDAEIAAQEAARVAAEQEAARVAQEQERQRAIQEQRQREAREAERARLAAQRERQEREEQMRLERERMEQEEAERRERERRAAIAAAEAERADKLAQIEALQSQIAAASMQLERDEAANEFLAEAVSVSEELLDVLAAEQAKYEDTDEMGNTVEALAKQRIADLEALKAELLRQVQSQ